MAAQRREESSENVMIVDLIRNDLGRTVRLARCVSKACLRWSATRRSGK